MNSGPIYVYILRCANNSLYVGVTDDIPTRLELHNQGRGARHTALHRPVHLAHKEGPLSLNEGIAREAQLKRWSRAKKEALVAGNLVHLHRLSKSRENQPR
jgi:predicted GIY-YIG superfamily endonuclease